MPARGAHLRPCSICKPSSKFYDAFDTCPITIISRIMHFLYIIYHIWCKKHPFTGREFEVGSSWSESWRTQSFSLETLRTGGVLRVQCPLPLPIFLSHLEKVSLLKKKPNNHPLDSSSYPTVPSTVSLSRASLPV